jgi:hypothetical protein
LSFGLGGGQIAVPLTAEDRDLLTFAAGERGVSSDVLMAKIGRAGLRERLTNAVLDDQDSGARDRDSVESRTRLPRLVCGVVAIFVTSVGKLGIGRDLAPADVYKTLLHLRIRIAPPTRS